MWILLFSLNAFAASPLQDATSLLAPVLNANGTLNKQGPTNDMTCACSIQGSDNQVTFETWDSCGPDRNYLQKDLRAFAKIDPNGNFLRTRLYVPGNNRVPQKCVLYVMRTAFRDVARTPEQKKAEDIAAGKLTAEEIAAKNYTPDHNQFASCASANATPVSIRQKPCVTEPYFNLIYNSLSDVADCMGLPMNFTVPKFANESGLNVNVLGPVNDGGVGQFTESALEDVAAHYSGYRDMILGSKNPACQRLRSIPGALPASASEIHTSDAERCHVISMPPNPVRSMIYYGIFFHSLQEYANTAWAGVDPKDPAAETLEQLLTRAEGKNKLDFAKIKQMLFTMAYNSGPRPPVTAIKEWLRYRIANKAGISAKDFDFNFWPPKGFSAIQKDAEKDVVAIALAKGWDEARTRREVALERVKRRTAHVGATGRMLTLPEYFYVYQNSIYISAVKVQARELDKALGAGTCTQPKFLAL